MIAVYHDERNFSSLCERSASYDEVDYTDYRYEQARLNSFVNWPVPFMDPRKLAAAGFYYMGKRDEVICFECKCRLHDWAQNDDVMTLHQRWSGKCRFLRNISCGNVPIGVHPSKIPPYTKIKNICGTYGTLYKPYSGPDNDLNVKGTNFPQSGNSNTGIGVSSDENATSRDVVGDVVGAKYVPQYPSYTLYEQRLQSFETWPKYNSCQKKEDMAAAGFFYTNLSDRTKCFYCGICLIEWLSTDVPIDEHMKWTENKCPFAKSITKKQSEKNDDQFEAKAGPSRESKTSDSS